MRSTATGRVWGVEVDDLGVGRGGPRLRKFVGLPAPAVRSGGVLVELTTWCRSGGGGRQDGGHVAAGVGGQPAVVDQEHVRPRGLAVDGVSPRRRSGPPGVLELLTWLRPG